MRIKVVRKFSYGMRTYYPGEVGELVDENWPHSPYTFFVQFYDKKPFGIVKDHEGDFELIPEGVSN